MALSKKQQEQGKQANASISDIGKQAEKVATDIITKQADTPTPKVVKFTKPNGDFYKLDLVVRETVMGANKHMVTTETIKRDYKSYLQSVCGSEGMTKYIQALIEKDAKKNGYKFE